MPSLSPLSSLDKTYSIANVFVTKVLIADTVFAPPTWDGTARQFTWSSAMSQGLTACVQCKEDTLVSGLLLCSQEPYRPRMAQANGIALEHMYFSWQTMANEIILFSNCTLRWKDNLLTALESPEVERILNMMVLRRNLPSPKQFIGCPSRKNRLGIFWCFGWIRREWNWNLHCSSGHVYRICRN